jgi:hypothetical protein
VRRVCRVTLRCRSLGGGLGSPLLSRYQKSGKMLHLRRSRELYRTAFQGDPKDYYTGINAATKSLFLGESLEAERLAGEVIPLVEAASNGNDFWAGCIEDTRRQTNAM